ncbi:MAG: Glu-tRNA(Gln) amidotransferase subunit GatE [Candidatus Hodarchaeales archaeon]
MYQDFKFDYKKLGLKAGLEIHAQLQSDRKLFCHCKPKLLLPSKPDYRFERRFRPVLGEMGDFDSGMLVEFEKSYRVIYETFNDESICTYEMDETPPFEPDLESIKIGYKISDFFNCQSPVDEIIFNRKQYLDGSIPTGFQRTTVVARDGFVRLNGKKIRINNVLIEEDSARRIRFNDRVDRTVYFNLDRLGIPLTEIITNHEDCSSPEELFNAAMLIGMSLRILGVAKRGIGTVRQDINISISGGARVELKGVQDIRNIEKFVKHEIYRQVSLLEIKDELLQRGLTAESFQPNFIDVSSAIYQLPGNEVSFAVRLPRCKGIFLKEVQPNKTFGEEIFDRCELITGISMDNMSHSDKPAHWLDTERVEDVLNLSEDDAYIIIKGNQDNVLHALNRLNERISLALTGVPQETRRVNTETGNSEFLRVIHGKDRMYSDTDTPPVSISPEIRNVSNDVFIKPWELFEQYSLDIFEIDFLIDNEFYNDFGVLAKDFPEKVRSILGYFQFITSIVRKLGLSFHTLAKHGYQDIIKDLLNKRISKDDIPEILKNICSGDKYIKLRDKFVIDVVISKEIVSTINIILHKTSNNISTESPRKLFSIVRTHFPMLKTEQIIYAINTIKDSM